MLENFSNQAIKVIDQAKLIADEMNDSIVGSEHLLLALFDMQDSICHLLLSERLITKEDILKEINSVIILRNKRKDSIYTIELTEIVKMSSKIATKKGNKERLSSGVYYHTPGGSL